MGLSEWLAAIKTNPYKQAYDSRKGFWQNCEDIGAMSKEMRKKQAKQSKQLKEFRALKKLEEK